MQDRLSIWKLRAAAAATPWGTAALADTPCTYSATVVWCSCIGHVHAHIMPISSQALRTEWGSLARDVSGRRRAAGDGDVTCDVTCTRCTTRQVSGLAQGLTGSLPLA